MSGRPADEVRRLAEVLGIPEEARLYSHVEDLAGHGHPGFRLELLGTWEPVAWPSGKATPFPCVRFPAADDQGDAVVRLWRQVVRWHGSPLELVALWTPDGGEHIFLQGLERHPTQADLRSAHWALSVLHRTGGPGRPPGSGAMYADRAALVAAIRDAVVGPLRGRVITLRLLLGRMVLEKSAFHEWAKRWGVDWREEVDRAGGRTRRYRGSPR